MEQHTNNVPVWRVGRYHHRYSSCNSGSFQHLAVYAGYGQEVFLMTDYPPNWKDWLPLARSIVARIEHGRPHDSSHLRTTLLINKVARHLARELPSTARPPPDLYSDGDFSICS
jgi:hypothetical protein